MIVRIETQDVADVDPAEIADRLIDLDYFVEAVVVAGGRTWRDGDPIPGRPSNVEDTEGVA